MSDLLESLRAERLAHGSLTYAREVCTCGHHWPCIASRALDVAIGLGEKVDAVRRAAEGTRGTGVWHKDLVAAHMQEALTAAKKRWEEGR